VLSPSKSLLSGDCEECGHPLALHPFIGERKMKGCLTCRIDARLEDLRRATIVDWRCRCGRKVLEDGEGCLWHASVRERCLDGTITRAEDAR
jgi:hypothetical protein